MQDVVSCKFFHKVQKLVLLDLTKMNIVCRAAVLCVVSQAWKIHGKQANNFSIMKWLTSDSWQYCSFSLAYQQIENIHEESFRGVIPTICASRTQQQSHQLCESSQMATAQVFSLKVAKSFYHGSQNCRDLLAVLDQLQLWVYLTLRACTIKCWECWGLVFIVPCSHRDFPKRIALAQCK
jgi:hypothetical protein